MTTGPTTWQWRESPVDRATAHFELRHGSSEKGEWDTWLPVALVGPACNDVFPVQFLIDGKGEKNADIVRDVTRELTFYLVEKMERDPWGYAQYHCGTAANLYSSVHWAFFESVKPRAGRHTADFGVWLTGELKQQDLVVYYDHGIRGPDQHVTAVEGFVDLSGERVHNWNRLADVDLMVVKGDEIVLLIEIEERAASPKKILGTTLVVMMCNRFAAKPGKAKQYFKITPDTRLIVAGVLPTRGYRAQKLADLIRPRFLQFSGPGDGLRPENVEFVFSETIDSAIRELTERTLALLGKP